MNYEMLYVEKVKHNGIIEIENPIKARKRCGYWTRYIGYSLKKAKETHLQKYDLRPNQVVWVENQW